VCIYDNLDEVEALNIVVFFRFGGNEIVFGNIQFFINYLCEMLSIILMWNIMFPQFFKKMQYKMLEKI
jgi:hypothetical protein